MPLEKFTGSTQEILARSDSAFHLLKTVGNPIISSQSRWKDDVWRLDNTTPGASITDSSIRWSFLLPDGSLFTDPQWSNDLDIWRRFVWSLFVDPRDGLALKTGNGAVISNAVSYFINWMKRRSYTRLDELGAEAQEDFIEQLVPETNLNEDESEDDQNSISYSTLHRRFKLWVYLWKQREIFIEIGVPALQTVPFAGLSSPELAKQVVTKVVRGIRPLPDEVALPIMTAAHRLLSLASDDVILAQRIFLDAYGMIQGTQSEENVRSKYQVAYAKLNGYSFSKLINEDTPWHKPLGGKDDQNLDEKNFYRIANTLRRLVLDIRNACVITLQSAVGLRINEICGLRSGNSEHGWPACIETRISKTGLFELFYLKGVLAKTRIVPESAEWLLGSRLIGSKEIPFPVRAVQVLERLLEPWRNMAESNDDRNFLLLSFSNPVSFPTNGRSVGKITSLNLLSGQKEFVERYVNLSNLPDVSRSGENLVKYRLSKGRCLSTHQWRKTFALYVFRVDSRMIPAIAQQFQHLSLAMTEQGYIGVDATLLEAFDSVRLQRTAEFFYQATNSKMPFLFGRFSESMDIFRDGLKALISGKNKIDSLSLLEAKILRSDLRIWFSPPGKCFIGTRPNESRCHAVAGTLHWTKKEPNYETRNVDLCIGCACFAIDGEHVDYWEKRYVENQRVWNSVSNTKEESHFRIAKERAAQSLKVLNALGVNPRSKGVGKTNENQ